ncbi:hypothetical protein ACFOG5_07365 [Pedobacter fastidiosus]|uniref:Branched-chain amino acid:cation transporter, LIVCS family n=1 Tax=Pedobacter fastidiosus TaxID=2765361 RepID=A0ABR7KPK8_9SPHI|nr:hypothetical protein [Pedobacter fastidiosus]MBC6110022.1 hypothetical protein [Pedobacter fastidiosus]
MKTENDYPLYIVSFSRKISLYSFVSGVLITILYILTKEGFLMSFGLLYTVIAFFANIIVLLMLLGTMIIHQDHWKDITISLLILLANIPAFFACFYLVTQSQF